MNRRSFIVRCVSAVAAVVFPWKSASANELTVENIRAAKEVLDAPTTFAEIASKFQWNCTHLPGRGWLIQCWGEFQDGLDYECAEFVNFEGEYVEHEYARKIWEETDPEALLQELAITFDKAMRTRFNQIEGHFDINAYGACVDK